MRRDAALLDDIVQHCDRILEIVAGDGRELIESDAISQAAVLHHLTVIGEAAARLSAEFCSRHAEIPWASIVSQRNRIVHEYFGIDWQLVWKTVAVDLPVLRAQVNAVLERELPEG
jgi:uncharacterized protein with HEPN domain